MNKGMFQVVFTIIIGYIVFWYAGGMINFIPFIANDFAVRAIGFTGLLLCSVIVFCACWIIREMKKK